MDEKQTKRWSKTGRYKSVHEDWSTRGTLSSVPDGVGRGGRTTVVVGYVGDTACPIGGAFANIPESFQRSGSPRVRLYFFWSHITLWRGYVPVMRVRCKQTGEEVDIRTMLNLLDSSELVYEYEVVYFGLSETVTLQLKRRSSSSKEDGGMLRYLVGHAEATCKCTDLLSQAPYLKRNLDGNIFCPFHEDRRTSSTPSARLYRKSHLFVCFSSRCNNKMQTKRLYQCLLTMMNKK